MMAGALVCTRGHSCLPPQRRLLVETIRGRRYTRIGCRTCGSYVPVPRLCVHCHEPYYGRERSPLCPKHRADPAIRAMHKGARVVGMRPDSDVQLRECSVCGAPHPKESYRTGTREDGQPIYSHACERHRPFADEDGVPFDSPWERAIQAVEQSSGQPRARWWNKGGREDHQWYNEVLKLTGITTHITRGTDRHGHRTAAAA